MDANTQISAIKMQIENIKFQIDSMQMINNNLLMMNNNSTSEQLLNLSIQLFNTGIQTFNIGKNMSLMIDNKKYYDPLKNISKRINSIINDMEQMIQNQIMQQQMMMQQQQMMQHQQVEAQQQLMNQFNINFKKINVVFINIVGNRITIRAKVGTTVKELLDEYMKRAFGFPKENIIFIYNAIKINRYELTTVEKFFRNNQGTVMVFETK